MPCGCVLNVKVELLWLKIRFCCICFLTWNKCEVWFNCVIKPQVTRKPGYRKWLAGWIRRDNECLPLAERGLTFTIYFVPSGSHLYLGTRRRSVLNESLHACPRFLQRVVFKQSPNSTVLRLGVKNTLDASPSPGRLLSVVLSRLCSLFTRTVLLPRRG